MSIWNFPNIFTSALKGIVAPSGGGTVNFLRADGSWAAPPNTTYAVFTPVANGLAPLSGGGTANYLRADGNWITPPDTTYAVFTSVANGLVPLSGGGTTNFLRADGSWAAPPGGGGGGQWSLAFSTTLGGAVANVDITGLAGATDLMVVVTGLAVSVSGVAIIQVSVDNGVSFFSASGNYLAIDAPGTATNTTGAALWGTNATAARYGCVTLPGVNVPNCPKPMLSALPTTTSLRIFVADLVNPINALRIIPSGGGTLGIGGSIYVFKRV